MMADAGAPTEGGRPTYVMQGTNGIVECWSDRVVVRRTGGWLRLGTGFARSSERPLPYPAVQSVEVQWASRFRPGYLTFTLRGAVEPTRNPAAQRRDEYAVAFRSRDNDVVREMKGYIEARLDAPPAAGEPAPQPAEDRLDKLERLARLHADGQLTDEEFEAEKQRLV